MSAFEQLRDLVAEPLKLVSAACADCFNTTENEVIRQICVHIMSGRSKRLRPMITLASAIAAGEDPKNKVKLAACLELIHTATLLHDDVMDAGDLRRGKIAANNLWGNRESILVGDFLLSRAFHLVVKDVEPQTLDLLANLAAALVEGEVMQISASGNLRLRESEYIAIVKAKTASLFAAAAELGSGERYRRAMAGYGLNLGIAFQCGDDVLDYAGAARGARARVGKTCGQDFKEGKITLPLLLAVQKAKDKRFWRQAFRDRSPQKFSQAVELMESDGIFASALKRGRAYAERAVACLEPLPRSEAKKILAKIAFYALERES